MSNYVPVTVTRDNFEWAIRENMRRIDAAMATKLHVADDRPLKAEFDVNDTTLQNVLASELPHAAATYGQALHLSLSALLLVEDGDPVALVEGGAPLRLF